jgi:TetR/AcrR family fatty acid metabolism transcriptional regulator
MASSRKIKIYDHELRQLIFSELYLRYSEPKAQRRALGILEVTIQCLAQRGFEDVTLAMIARSAGITRPLVRHYFTDMGELFDMSIKYIRILFQRLAVEAMMKSTQPDEMLRMYVCACFLWVDNHKTHAQVWFHFLLHCSRLKKYRELNTLAVRRGEERIQALLEKGRELKQFHFSDAATTAKMVQTMITGGLIAFISEDFEDKKEFVHNVQSACFALLSTGIEG